MFLKDNKTGKEPVYETDFEIVVQNNKIFVKYTAYNSKFYCPYKGYNQNHYLGDVCELFIGNRNEYYELEINPNNDIFFKKIHFNYETNEITADNISYENYCEYIHTEVDKLNNCYVVYVEIDKSMFDYEDIVYNAYRIECDGDTPEKYLFALYPTMCNKFHRPQFFECLDK